MSQAVVLKNIEKNIILVGVITNTPAMEHAMLYSTDCVGRCKHEYDRNVKLLSIFFVVFFVDINDMFPINYYFRRFFLFLSMFWNFKTEIVKFVSILKNFYKKNIKKIV